MGKRRSPTRDVRERSVASRALSTPVYRREMASAAPAATAASSQAKIRYAVDTEKSVLIDNFERRGWVRYSDQEGKKIERTLSLVEKNYLDSGSGSWNFYWYIPKIHEF